MSGGRFFAKTAKPDEMQSSEMKLIRYTPEYQDAMLALHRSAIEGFDLGMSQQQDEADLLDLEHVYIRPGGEFLLGFVGPKLMAMGALSGYRTAVQN